jgi:hypothetical protein
VGLGVGLAVGLAVGLGDALDVGLGLADVLGEGDAVVEGLAEDDDVVVGSAPDFGAEHAETVREASMVTMPQPTTASLVRRPVPAVAARTFIEPPDWPETDPLKRRGP